MTEYFTEDETILRIKNAKEFDVQAFAEAALEERAEDGSIDAEKIVRAAENNPAHPAYKHLEWDDKKAAHKHRIDQVRALLRYVNISLPGRTEIVPAFISLPAKEGGGRGYYKAAEVVSSERLTDLLLEQAERDIAAWNARYGMLLDLGQYAKAALESIRKEREKTTETRQHKRRRHSDQPSA